MNENSKVMIRVEYDRGGIKKVCHGEIDETKLENFEAGEENFIWMENDGNITWIDKETLISIETLCVKSTVFVRPRIKDLHRANTNKDSILPIA